MKTKDPLLVGKAYSAWLIYNHKVKQDRLTLFHLDRWIKVINFLSNKQPKTKDNLKWTPERRIRFKRTIALKKQKLSLSKLNGPKRKFKKIKPSIPTEDLLK